MFEIMTLEELTERVSVGLRKTPIKVVCDERDLDAVKSLVGDVDYEFTHTESGYVAVVYADY